MELVLVKREVEEYSQWYQGANEWPEVLVQGIQRVEPQRFESQVVEIVQVEERVD